jgi:hypothetical protein
MAVIDVWQAKFDQWFPRGVSIERVYGDPETDPVYRCPQVTVLDMPTALPRVYFVPYDVWGKSFYVTLMSWKQTHSDPEVFAAADSEGRSWRFSNAISDQLAAELVPFRNQSAQGRDFILSLER